MTDVGARKYDPTTGRFISLDPLLNGSDPQSLNGYTYTDDNPTTGSDPSGLCPPDKCGYGTANNGHIANTGPVDPGNPGAGTRRNGTFIPPAKSAPQTKHAPVASGSQAPSQQKNDMVVGWLGGQCYTSSPVCPFDQPGGGVNPHALAYQAALACLQNPTCQTADDLNALLAVSEDGALNTLNDTLQKWLALEGILGLSADGIGLLGEASDAGSGAATGSIRGGGTVYGLGDSGPLPDSVASTFTDGTYTETITTGPTALYRVYGGTAREMGGYWSRTLPASSADAVRDSALDPAWGNTAEHWVSIEVPEGQTLYEGTAAPQGALPGGGSQVLLQGRVDPAWITGRGSY